MAQHTAPQRKVDLGPGFWPVTIGLGILNVLITVFIIIFPIERFIPEMGEPSGDIDWLFKFMSVFGNAIFVYVVGYLIYFSIVWRRRKSDPVDAIGIQIHDAPKLELWWTLVPAVLVILLAGFSVRIWMNLQNQLGDVLTMEAIGHQFKYEFRYPKLKSSVYDEMHVPVNTPVTLNVTAADVLHSFWSPEMRIKADMVPGLVQTLRFTPTHVGKYRIICTEFCGTQHANMGAALFVDSQAGFNGWLATQVKTQSASGAPLALAGGNAAAGKATFGQKCSSCHNAAGGFTQKIVGPGLAHLANDPAYPKLVTGQAPDAKGISYILVNGYQGPDNSQGKNGPSLGVMPNRAANVLNNTDIANLTAYLLSLSSKK